MKLLFEPGVALMRNKAAASLSSPAKRNASRTGTLPAVT
jgi:hypothetical protein